MSKLQSLVGELLVFWWPKETIHVNHRPPWLFGMEMDFYLPNLRLAIEVQGRQHKYFCPKFHPTIEHFKAQQCRDENKGKLIRNNGIRLVCIHESSKKPALGLTSILKQWYEGRFYFPVSMQVEFRKHQDLLRSNHIYKNIAFKPRTGLDLLAFNDPSKHFLASKRHIPLRSPAATTTTVGNAPMRVKHGQMDQKPAG